MIACRPLPDKILEKAKNELREDETRKQQALQHFREWLSKHPYIKEFRQDDLFLLQFLRAKKYVMDSVFTSFENYVHAQKKYSKWFDISEEDNKRMIELYRTGYAFPLAERDEEGRRVIFIQLRNIDPDYFTSSDAIRLTTVISASLMEEEETQICGIASIIDHEGVTMKQASMFSVTDIVDFASCCSKAVGRYKECVVVNLPSFSNFLFEIGRNALPEKLRKRIILAKTMDDVKNYVNVDLLPKEYGGKLPKEEHKEIFTKYFHSILPNLHLIKKRVVLWDKIPEMKASSVDETVGSFRKLEID